MANEDRYLADVEAALRRALAEGDDESRFWRALAGADPRLISELRERTSISPAEVQAQRERRNAARRYTAEIPLRLPAPDPMSSQWWFTLDAVEFLADRAQVCARDGLAVFLGAPTVGHYYCLCNEPGTTILDIDAHVIESIKASIAAARVPECVAEVYDVGRELPPELRARYAVAVIDPPWYPSLIWLFLSRARQLIRDDGFIICVLPPLLTRPSIPIERTELVSGLLSKGYQILSLETQAVDYEVPTFELAAFQDIDFFNGRPWRAGDLLTVQASNDSSPLSVDPMPLVRLVSIFSRDPKKLRLFLDESRVDPGLSDWAVPVPEFEENVSTRATDIEKIAAWGSNRKAARIRDASVVRAVLSGWEGGNPRDDTVLTLRTSGVVDADEAFRQIRTCLGLTDSEPGESCRRPPERMEQVQNELLSHVASQPSTREHGYHGDGFRLAFQRDRDRISWSGSFRRLANKTQVFPVDSDEQLRRRLTHSMEVMQLASTIARAFGLDPDLTEAGALGHDLGHAPFGHAGEYALDFTLKQVAPEFGGFNHYEHGADVVRYLEDAYVSPGIGAFPGLNLTPQTIECILKHTYYRDKHELSQTEVLKRSKHADIVSNTSGSLEAQSVRIADKVSYLISDLEDGIRLGAITSEHIRGCRLFDHPPIDIRPSGGEALFQRFVSQRRALLRVLMEDILVATDRRLGDLRSLEDVRAAHGYTVSFSPAIDDEVGEVWGRLQERRLHRDGRVVNANLRAGKIVSSLFLLYIFRPELIDDAFRRNHALLRDTSYLHYYLNRVHRDFIGVPKRLVSFLALDRMIGSGMREEGDNFLVSVYDIVLAKDYVAGLADTRAIAVYEELIR